MVNLKEIVRSKWQRELAKRGFLYRFETKVIQFKYPLLFFHNALVQVQAAARNKAVVHVIGDSHIRPYIFQYPFIIHHIDQATAYNLDEENSTTQSKQKLARILSGIDKKRDIVLMVFGEIDARIHIYYQYEKRNRQVNINRLIYHTVEKYGKTLLHIREMGYTISVYGITPAGSIDINHFRYPYYGTPEQRSMISRKFNERLKEYCIDHNLPFVDVYSITASDQGFIKAEFRGDDIHLNQKIVPFTRQQLKGCFNNI
jgi:hypothetical protein